MRPARQLTVAGRDGPGELAAVREHLFAWPLSLHDATFRLVLAVGPDHDAVILQVHHAAFDGVSSLALLRAICAAYQNRAGTAPAAEAGAGAGTGPGAGVEIAVPAAAGADCADRAGGVARRRGRLRRVSPHRKA